MYTLGINAAYHDSAACLVKDGVVFAAAEEERFTRRKHAKRPVPFSAWELPYHAIDYCLAKAGIELDDLDHVAYSYDPHLLLNGGVASTMELPLEPSAQRAVEGCESPWDPLFLSYIVNAPRQLSDGAPHHLRRRFRKREAQRPYTWHFVEHHTAHEASAYLAAPFEEAAVLTMDGRGERATTTYGVARGTRFERIDQVDLPHSLGLLYERITGYLGFLHCSDEYKVMALASFGRPAYRAAFARILEPRARGHYLIHDFDPVEEWGPARQAGAPLEQKHYDIACSLQNALEQTVMDTAQWLRQVTDQKNLCMSGGVALNCVLNGRLQRSGPFERVWVQPAAGDAGTALGAALWVDAQQRGGERRYVMQHAFLGPSYDDEQIESALQRAKICYRRFSHIGEVADLLAKDRLIGWFQGAMEFGPRALGARSILASPLNPAMQARLNDLKDREDFRPVAPAVLQEEAGRWFQGCTDSPFMLFVYDVMEDQRGRIPAVTHIDGSARVQTVNAEQHGLYYDLIKAFKQRTGVPVLINTSFNTRGEPIVCTPRDALESFWTSPLDALVIGSFILEKQGISHDRTGLGDRSNLPSPSSPDSVSGGAD